MPKVPPEHLEQRRRQILDAAMRLFARQGYAATSMQQITTASGLSAGAVYHYFPSKRGLINATGRELARSYREPLRELMDTTAGTPSPGQVLEAISAGLERIHGSGGIDFTRIGLFTWAEALHDPELAAEVGLVRQELAALLVPVIARWQQEAVVDPAPAPAEILAALYGLMPGFTLQLNLSPQPVDAAGYRRGAVALFGTRSSH